MIGSGPRVTAVVLAFRDEPLLATCVEALLSSDDVDLDVVVVDNGCTDDGVDSIRDRDGVTVLTPAANLGFAGGCNAGAKAATGTFLVFINGDAVVDPAAVARLVGALRPDVGLASGSLRLWDASETINSAGNPVHFTGLSWAGGLGEQATDHAVVRDIASATGAATAIRADLFDDLGGFYEEMFAYCEDTELSLRTWQRGLRVVYVPDAVVLHRYEFSRNPEKYYLLERNRLLMVLTLFQSRTLWLILPALAGLDLAVLAVATRQGWGRQKVRGWWWLWRHRSLIRARRAAVQAARSRSDRDLAFLLTGDFSPGGESGFAAPAALRRGSRAYWAIMRRFLPRRLSPSSQLTAVDDGTGTAGSEYAERLVTKSTARWKQLLDVQRPYRWNLKRLQLGRTLDVGCGIGRNLHNLGPDSVGVDHNHDAIEVAREAGLTAYTTDEFWATGVGEHGSFDSMLVAHVMEHVSPEVAESIVSEYLPCIRPGGKVVFITPQEVGYRSDPTHVRFVDLAELRRHAESLGLEVDRAYSFPFPRPVGKVFAYNEFVLSARKRQPA